MTTKNIYKDGIYDISIDDYHNSSGFSRTQLMCFDKSPYHFWYENLSGLNNKKESTDSLIIGNAVHCLLLQPELFTKEYAVLPKLDRRTTKGKEEYADFIELNEHKIILSFDLYEKIYSIVEHVERHDILNLLIKDSLFEQSIFWTDRDTGLQFKARPDVWSSKMIVDLKTTEDSNIYKFSNSALYYGYYLQAGMMFEAFKAIDKPIDVFTIVAIEKKAPHVPVVFMMDEKAIQFGIDQFNIYKNRLKYCLDSNEWPTYKVQELSVPKFATIKDEEEL